jgi:Spy/CpxP family protein refolding chaperone
MSVNNCSKGFMIALLLFASCAAMAQQPRRTPEERAGNQTRWMQHNLALTQNQSTRVYDIVLHYAREADNTNASIPPGEKRLEKRDIMRNKDAELKQVLTGEQFQKYQAHAKEMKNKMMERRAGMEHEGN